jgi:hypothetical protein
MENYSLPWARFKGVSFDGTPLCHPFLGERLGTWWLYGARGWIAYYAEHMMPTSAAFKPNYAYSIFEQSLSQTPPLKCRFGRATILVLWRRVNNRLQLDYFKIKLGRLSWRCNTALWSFDKIMLLMNSPRGCETIFATCEMGTCDESKKKQFSFLSFFYSDHSSTLIW